MVKKFFSNSLSIAVLLLAGLLGGYHGFVFGLGGLDGYDGSGCGTGLGEDPSCYVDGNRTVEGLNDYTVDVLTWEHDARVSAYQLTIGRTARFPANGSEVYHEWLYVGIDISCGTNQLTQGRLACTFPMNLRALTLNPQLLTVWIRGVTPEGEFTPYSSIQVEYASDIPAPRLLPLTIQLRQ